MEGKIRYSKTKDAGLIKNKERILEYAKHSKRKIPSIEVLRKRFGQDGADDELVMLRYLSAGARWFLDNVPSRKDPNSL